MEEQKIDGPTRPYDGYIHKIEPLVFLSDDTFSLIYFCSVGGREDKEKFEWKYGSLYNMANTRLRLADRLKQHSDDKAVFAISFPPITKIVGWEIGSKESNLQLIDFLDTISMESGPSNPSEIGCLLDLKIFEAEARFWAEAATLEHYFSMDRIGHWKAKLSHPNKLYEAKRKDN
jgi:hypothetical protein